VFPDFTHAPSRDWWGTLYKHFYSIGADGFWNDMNEPAVFQTATKTIPLDVTGRIEEPGFRSRIVTQREAHNVFGMENSRGTYEGLLKLNPNQRPPTPAASATPPPGPETTTAPGTICA
jgi:alpha-glucosidase